VSGKERRVDFAIPEEHALLRATVRDFFERKLPGERIRELNKAGKGPPDDIRAEMGELGWHGITIPTEHGRGGADVTTAAVLIEELARGCASLASDFVLNAMAAGLFTSFGSEEQHAAVLPGLASGY
jgi:alkylation response protein AidB-like acyl-CoA dehydrogenase